jgi:hypothetical protein
MRKVAWLLLLIFLPALLIAQEKERRSWYIGFGVGTFVGATFLVGSDELTWDDYFEGLDASPAVSINFKVGGTLNKSVLLGFDVTAIRQEGTMTGITVANQVNNYFGMVTVFPFEKGLFVRLGGGASAYVQEVELSGFGSDSETYSGYGVLGGVGYAFWLGKRFNLTLNVDYSRQWYTDDAGPDGTHYVACYVGFDWY